MTILLIVFFPLIYGYGEINMQSFEYADGQPVAQSNVRTHEVPLKLSGQHLYIRATFTAGDENPAPYINGHPSTAQTVAIGIQQQDQFRVLFTFGLADAFRGDSTDTEDDTITPSGARSERPENAYLTASLTAGDFVRFGPYARPGSQCQIKVDLNLVAGRLSAWARDYDGWYILAEDVAVEQLSSINHLHVSQTPGAKSIRNLLIAADPPEERDEGQVAPARDKQKVRASNGFRFQPMRSTWGQPGRHVAVSRKKDFHHGFPDVALVGSDTLVAAWANKSHSGGTGGVSVAASHDRGQTWGPDTLVAPGDANCPRIQCMSDGSLLVVCDFVLTRESQRHRDVLIYRSTDTGKSWNLVGSVQADGPGSREGVFVPSRIVELPDGSYLLGASSYGGTPMAPEPGFLSFYRSVDGGQNWSLHAKLAAFPPHMLNEPDIILLPDGRLVCYIREWRYDNLPGMKAISTDAGKTWKLQELPFTVTGRVGAGLLDDGRAMFTFRSGIGRAALWAWIGDVDDTTGFQPAGAHYHDARTVAIKDGALYIDNDGALGQFTQYFMRPADTTESVIDVTVEVKVLANAGKAATLSVPYVGKLRLFPDRIELAHDPSVKAAVTPGEFHLYRVVHEGHRARIYVDGEQVIETDKGDGRTWRKKAIKTSIYTLAFGNEIDAGEAVTNVFPHQITPEVNGCSIWQSVHEILDDPATGRKEYRWSADSDGFPDQYQLDHIIEVGATVVGGDQGYSGWVQFDDGRIFVVNYTDDTAPMVRWDPYIGGGLLGIPFVRGTFLQPSDLP